jgi:hypothetical protein
MPRLRVGPEEVETLDSVRFEHLLRFARSTGKSWSALEQLASGQTEIDPAALIDELQRLAQHEHPPEHIAPLIGLLRNDATRVQMLAAHHRS